MSDSRSNNAHLQSLINAKLMQYAMLINSSPNSLLGFNLSDSIHALFESAYPKTIIDYINWQPSDNNELPIVPKSMDLIVANVQGINAIDLKNLLQQFKQLLTKRGTLIFITDKKQLAKVDLEKLNIFTFYLFHVTFLRVKEYDIFIAVQLEDMELIDKLRTWMREQEINEDTIDKKIEEQDTDENENKEVERDEQVEAAEVEEDKEEAKEVEESHEENEEEKAEEKEIPEERELEEEKESNKKEREEAEVEQEHEEKESVESKEKEQAEVEPGEKEVEQEHEMERPELEQEKLEAGVNEEEPQEKEELEELEEPEQEHEEIEEEEKPEEVHESEEHEEKENNEHEMEHEKHPHMEESAHTLVHHDENENKVHELEHSREMLNAHAATLAAHVSSSLEIERELAKGISSDKLIKSKQAQLVNAEQKHKELVNKYKILYDKHNTLLQNFMNERENVLEKGAQAKNVYEHVVDEHKEELKKHETLLAEQNNLFK